MEVQPGAGLVTLVNHDRGEYINMGRKADDVRSCAAIMQFVENLELTTNHTLKRSIDAWLDSQVRYHQKAFPKPEPSADQLATVLQDVDRGA
ncbi:hypothetical protein OROGR_028265 [Orobanche gracilis]